MTLDLSKLSIGSNGHIDFIRALTTGRIAILKDVKANNVAGGTFTSGAFQNRILNTLEDTYGVVRNPLDFTGVGGTNTDFILDKGTYFVIANLTYYAGVNSNIAKLLNVTDTSDVLTGTADYGNNDSGTSRIIGRFTISSTKTFRFQHRCQSTQVSTGFGTPSNFGINETYSTAYILKLSDN